VIVDVHGHVTHPELFEKFPMPPALADIEGMLERKAEAGIGLTIVGSPVGFGTMMPVPGLDNYAQPADRLRSFHDWLAETVREHEGRLAAYCYTNPFDASLNEQTAATVREGGFVGLIVNTSVKGRYLDDPGADEFFAMAAELGVPVFLHPPAGPVGAGSVEDFRLVEQVGRFLDVTMCLATLIFSGRLEAHPNLKVVAATAGGAIGLLVGRLDSAYAPRHYGGGPAGGAPPKGGPPGDGPSGGGPPGGGPPPWARFENKITKPPSELLANVYVDTANSSLPNQLANLEVLGAGNLLFGTDSPPLATPLEEAIGMVRDLPLDDAGQAAILGGNAERLFRLNGASA
jgi:aminocarboxymuconate-semialdehyde decarboxylase